MNRPQRQHHVRRPPGRAIPRSAWGGLGLLVTFCVVAAFGAGTPMGPAARLAPAMVDVRDAHGSPNVSETRVAPGTTSEGLIEFNETGLPAHTRWYAELNGQNESSSSASIPFIVAYGTYTFRVGSAGYTASPDSGSVTLDHTARGEPVSFRLTWAGPYTATFTETGLPAGTTWFVTFNGTTRAWNTTTARYSDLSPGNYTFRVLPVGNDLGNPGGGTLTVRIVNVSLAIAFYVPVSSNPGPTPVWEWWFAVGVLALWGLWVAYIAYRCFGAPAANVPLDPGFQRSGAARFALHLGLMIAYLAALGFALGVQLSAGPLLIGGFFLVFLVGAVAGAARAGL